MQHGCLGATQQVGTFETGSFYSERSPGSSGKRLGSATAALDCWVMDTEKLHCSPGRARQAGAASVSQERAISHGETPSAPDHSVGSCPEASEALKSARAAVAWRQACPFRQEQKKMAIIGPGTASKSVSLLVDFLLILMLTLHAII